MEKEEVKWAQRIYARYNRFKISTSKRRLNSIHEWFKILKAHYQNSMKTKNLNLYNFFHAQDEYFSLLWISYTIMTTS